ncbi:MAG TPA: hypothetical protein VGK95_11460 [Caldimonas sp.]|jgi:hypothetical protein
MTARRIRAVPREPHGRSHPFRDRKSDSLLTPQNAVIALIDYQPSNTQV